MRELLIYLGLAPRGGNYETVRNRIKTLGLDDSRLKQHSGGTAVARCTERELGEAVRRSRSYAAVMRALGVRPGGNHARLKARVAELGLDVSHFVGQTWNRGLRLGPRKPIDDFLLVGRFIPTHRLKGRLIKAGLKRHSCEGCSRTTWNGLPIPLELDHINGRRDDNRLENLRLLCPNCHAQTPTYRGRNIGVAHGYSE